MFDINKLEVMDIVFADEAHERFFMKKVQGTSKFTQGQ